MGVSFTVQRYIFRLIPASNFMEISKKLENYSYRHIIIYRNTPQKRSFRGFMQKCKFCKT